MVRLPTGVAPQCSKRNNDSARQSPEVRMLPSPYGFGLAGFFLADRRQARKEMSGLSRLDHGKPRHRSHAAQQQLT